MHFARKRRIVGADRQKRDLDVVTLADFLETFEVGGVAAMKNRGAVRANNKAAKATMSIRQKPRAPMMGRRERGARRTAPRRLPFVEMLQRVASGPMR